MYHIITFNTYHNSYLTNELSLFVHNAPTPYSRVTCLNIVCFATYHGSSRPEACISRKHPCQIKLSKEDKIAKVAVAPPHS